MTLPDSTTLRTSSPRGAVPWELGEWSGEIAREFASPAFVAALSDLPVRVVSASPIHAAARSRSVRLALPLAETRTLDVAVKCFGPPGRWKDWADRRRGGKARRSWRIAGRLREHGAGTPLPVAWIERRIEGRLRESHLLTEYIGGLVSFRDELIRIYRTDPQGPRLMALLQPVADAIRAMHQAGVVHRDLGNQNILLKLDPKGHCEGVYLVDLNRARVQENLSIRDVARDLSRIHLPSDLFRILCEMYFAGPRPKSFRRWEDFHRRWFALHTWSRRYRHPFRTRRERTRASANADYPDERDIWIWDPRSAQAIAALARRERARHRSAADWIGTTAGLLRHALPLWRAHRAIRAEAFRHPVQMSGRFGIAVEPEPETWAREHSLLEALGRIPVMIRFYHHRREGHWEFLADTARQLHGQGRRVSVALVQDRRAVLDPASWSAFAERVVSRLADVAEHFEVGHAVNRVKWGLWNSGEYRCLLQPVVEIAARYPGIELIGPAAIDFEFPNLLALLKSLPEPFRFAALSHHLYVDRRGAPENRQGAFDTVDKFAMARAIARVTGHGGERLIVSEVNWPLAGTDVWSPTCSPYLWPGQPLPGSNVSESDYADYMIRYLLLAACSGLVERVYWWRLVARGFGLVDDSDAANWRLRPAYQALQFFLATVGSSAFVGRIAAPAGVHLLDFRAADQSRIVVAYAHPGESVLPSDIRFREARDRSGRAMPAVAARRLTGQVVYLIGVE